MRIATTFWLCIGALVIGYLATVALNSVLSRRNEALLERTVSVVFPAAKRSQAAQADFKRQLLAYQDAVVVGDADALRRADSIAAEVRLALEEILVAGDVNAQRRQQADRLVTDLAAYASAASATYGPLANGEIGADLLRRAASLDAQGKALEGRLDDLSKDVSVDLRTSISDTISATVHQRAASEIAFAVIVLGTLAVITVIIERWARRLDELMYASGRLTQGDYTCEISGRGSDELGRLAQAFHEMRNAMAQRDQELRTFNETLEVQVQQRTGEIEAQRDDLESQIMQRRRAEQSLRLLESAVTALPEAMLIATPDADPRRSRVEFANPAYARILGCSLEECQRIGMAALCGAGGVVRLSELVTEVLAGHSGSTTIAALVAVGTQMVDLQAAPIVGEGGVVTGIVYLVRPVLV